MHPVSAGAADDQSTSPNSFSHNLKKNFEEKNRKAKKNYLISRCVSNRLKYEPPPNTVVTRKQGLTTPFSHDERSPDSPEEDATKI
jgi:hypothetical protein